MSLMTSLSVGVTGLKTAQTGVNTTAHNLSNVNTEGYTRQEIINVDKTYNRNGASHISYNQLGLGTEVGAVKQNRNVFYDQKYRLEVGRQSFYQVQSDSVTEIESLMGEMQGAQFQTTLNDLWESIEDLTMEPDNIVKRTNLINTANTFVLRAQDVYSQLVSYQDNLNKQIQTAVEEVNKIGDQINALNKVIVQKESGQEAANDYRDKRNLLLDQLAEYANISYEEDIDGRVLVSVEGTQFVTSDYVYHMQTADISQQSSLVDVVWGTGQSVFPTDRGFSTDKDTDVGKIKSMLIARGDHKATYVDIPDTDATNAEISEYNKTVGASVIMSTQASFDRLVNAVVTAINDALCPNVSGTDFVSNMQDLLGYDITATATITDSDGNAVNLSNVSVWDEANAAVGMDEDASQGVELFTRQSVARYQKATMTYTDPNGNTQTHTVYLYNKEPEASDQLQDRYGRYSIEQLVVSKDIKENPSKLPLSSNNLSGNADGYDAATCERLTAVWSDAAYTINPNVLTKHNFKDYYQALIGNLATVGNEYDKMAEDQETLVNSIDDNRQTVSGVSSDEQLTYLIQFQYAYTASSRYISTVDQMLEHLLNALG